MEEQLVESNETRHGNNNTAIVFVSLYFLLLAFFIYLTSISVPKEDRIQKVIGSIEVTFSGEKVTPSYISEPNVPGSDLGLAQFHAELRQVFEAAIPLVENEVNEEGAQLLFRVPVSQLYVRGEVAYRENREELFSEVARILVKRASVQPTDVELLYDQSINLPKSNSLEGDLSVKRLGHLVSSFLDKGVAKRNIFIGLGEQGRDEVIFRFYERNAVTNLFFEEAPVQ
ncbi:hypothetical protein GUA87_15750 [Sneathiella sp. P13V-1]|uniref:hypothetical protein n=1 Tax=Sneathiella sp. P13V-1 TaxID=2697366 RepID=UPI00187BBAED|nr:hypothetical protein [Sneathiella sp. P13V-1]MBE7638312.1 hypothetical protein [Sneathiella sp. P13V-1]